MTVARQATHYRSDWAYPLARLPGIVVLLVGWTFALPSLPVFAVAWFVALIASLWCFRDWPLDRVLEWLHLDGAARALDMFGEASLTESEAQDWLRKHPDQRDLATFEALLIAGRQKEALRLLDELPGATQPRSRFYRARVAANDRLREGNQPDLDALRALAGAVADPDERRFARASLLQLAVLMAGYGHLPIAQVRGSARRVGRELTLPRSREFALLFSVFAPVVIVLALFALSLVVGGL